MTDTKLKYLIPIAVTPLLMAWGLTSYLFGSLTGAGANYDGATDGYGSMLLSFSIIFCIAIWVGALFSYLLVKHGDRAVGKH